MKKISLFCFVTSCLFILTACSNDLSSTHYKADDEEMSHVDFSSQSEESEKTYTSSSDISSTTKATGYTFDLSGTADKEGSHTVTADEAGEYQVECFDVPIPENFYEYPDYEDLMAFITVFPDNGNYDMTFDSDKAIYDEQLCTAGNISELHKNGIETAHYSTIMDLQKGNKIMVLNGSVRLTKN